MRVFLRNIHSVIYILAMGVLFSCGKGEITESMTWNDVVLKISLKDASGSELFNPDDQAHFIGGEIVGLDFQGKLYPLESEPEKGDKTLHLYISKSASRHYLTFGPLDGAMDMDVTMLVKFTNSVKWEIRYSCSDHDETTLSCQRKWFYNNEIASNPLYLVRRSVSSSSAEQ